MIIAGMCCICALITWLRKIAYTVSVKNNKFVIFLNVWDKKHAGCQKQNESLSRLQTDVFSPSNSVLKITEINFYDSLDQN